VLQQVGQLPDLEQIVDRRHLEVAAVGQDAEHAAADAAEAVDADPGHGLCSLAPAFSRASISWKRRMRSISRWATPQPLSNQVRVLEALPASAMVAKLSKVPDASLRRMSDETMALSS